MDSALAMDFFVDAGMIDAIEQKKTETPGFSLIWPWFLKSKYHFSRASESRIFVSQKRVIESGASHGYSIPQWTPKRQQCNNAMLSRLRSGTTSSPSLFDARCGNGPIQRACFPGVLRNPQPITLRTWETERKRVKHGQNCEKWPKIVTVASSISWVPKKAGNSQRELGF